MNDTSKRYNNLPKITNIRTRIVIIITFISIISVSIFAYGLFKSQLESLFQSETQIYLDEISTRGVDSVKRKINGDVNLLRELSLLLGSTDDVKMENWTSILMRNGILTEFDRISIILPNGQGYGSLANETNFSNQSYFQKAIDGEIGISNIVIEQKTHRRMLYYAIPISQKGHVVAVLAAAINTEVLEDVLSLPSFNGEGYSYIIENNGKLIIHSRQPNNTDIQSINIFNNMDYPNSSITNMQSNMKQGQNGELTYTENGTPKHLMYKALNINNWYLVTVIPEEITAYKTETLGTLALILTGLIAITMFAFIIYIIFEQNRHKKTLMQVAYVDEVTGALNKNSFKLKSEELIKKEKSQYAFILLDIEKFKIINDVFGYNQGDMLLQHIAQVISNDMNKNEVFARIDSDKFYILMNYITPENIIVRVEQIMSDISNYQFADGSLYRTVVCAGIYIIENTNMSIDSMSDRANLANRKLKGNHLNTHYFYNDEIRNQLIEEQEIENEMQQALENKEFEVYLQPKYDILTEKIAGAEALVRWHHPKKGLISPGSFIPLFEKDGFVTKVDMFILDEVCKQQKEWLEQGHTPVIISVNQSKLHLYNSNYLHELQEITYKYQLDPRYIELEITESAVFDNVEILIDITNKLHQLGFHLSIDDFGTGYSSLNVLKDIVLDTLKLDGGFFIESGDIERSHAITKNIIRMAKELGMRIVAEGVEKEEQVAFLREIGCDLIQGFYYAKPMPMDEFYRQLLHEQNN